MLSRIKNDPPSPTRRPSSLHGPRSAAEASYAQRLDLLKRGGKIIAWQRGTAQVLIQGPTRQRRVTYTPDFVIRKPDGSSYAVDVKGAIVRDLRIKVLLWEQRFPNLPLVIVDVDGNPIDLFTPRAGTWRARGRLAGLPSKKAPSGSAG